MATPMIMYKRIFVCFLSGSRPVDASLNNRSLIESDNSAFLGAESSYHEVFRNPREECNLIHGQTCQKWHSFGNFVSTAHKKKKVIHMEQYDLARNSLHRHRRYHWVRPWTSGLLLSQNHFLPPFEA